MNILMMTNTYLPHVGGVARSVASFSEALRQRGHRVTVGAPTFEGTPLTEEDVVRFPALQNFNGSDFSVRLPVPGILSQVLDETPPDLVHSHHPFLLGDNAVLLATQHNLPLVFTHHTTSAIPTTSRGTPKPCGASPSIWLPSTPTSAIKGRQPKRRDPHRDLWSQALTFLATEWKLWSAKAGAAAQALSEEAEPIKVDGVCSARQRFPRILAVANSLPLRTGGALHFHALGPLAPTHASTV